MSKETNLKTDSQPSKVAFSIDEIAQKIGGSVYNQKETTNQKKTIFDIKPLHEASSGHLTFFAPSNKKSHAELLKLAESSEASAIILKEPLRISNSIQIICEHPLKAILQISKDFKSTSSFLTGVHPTAQIDSSAKISKSASVGAFSVIGANVEIKANSAIYPHVVIYDNVIIGNNSVIHSHASIRENTIIEDDCIIQNGSTIGSDGFGYVPDREKGHIHVPHIGKVKLEKQVEVGANSSIDRGTLGYTKIGAQTKIDNQVQIGHNNQIGKRTLICGQVGVGGSCEIGSDVVLAGCVGVADHIKIEDGVRSAGMTGISRSLTNPNKGSNKTTDYAGLPPVEVSAWRRQAVSLSKLPSLLKEFKKLIKRIENLERHEK